MLTKLGGVNTRKVVLGSLIGGSSLAYLGPKLYSYGPQPLQATEEKKVRNEIQSKYFLTTIQARSNVTCSGVPLNFSQCV